MTPSSEKPSAKKPVKKATDTQPSAQGAGDEPIVEDVAPKTKKVQPIEEDEPILPKPAPPKVKPSEAKENITVPSASSPAVVKPMK